MCAGMNSEPNRPTLHSDLHAKGEAQCKCFPFFTFTIFNFYLSTCKYKYTYYNVFVQLGANRVSVICCSLHLLWTT